MVGVISLSLRRSCERIAFARDKLGVRLFQISLPSWGALEDAEVRTFFDTVLGTYRGLPVPALQPAAHQAPGHRRANTRGSRRTIRTWWRPRTVPIRCQRIREPARDRTDVAALPERARVRVWQPRRRMRTADQSGDARTFPQGQRFFEAGQRRDVDTLLRMEAELSQLGEKFQACVGGGRAPIDGAFDKVLWWLHDQRFPLRLLPPYAGRGPGRRGGVRARSCATRLSGLDGVAAAARLRRCRRPGPVRDGTSSSPSVKLEWSPRTTSSRNGFSVTSNSTCGASTPGMRLGSGQQ